jgi:hypothetical protein
MKKLEIQFLLIVFFIPSSLIFAQYTDVINSNRPGLSKSAFSVGTKVIQFEVGPYVVSEKHTPLQYEVSGFGADFAVRYGFLFEQLELNIEGIFQNDTFTDKRSTIPQENSRSNFRTISIGAKYLILDPHKNSENNKPNLYSYHANRKFKWKELIPAISIYAGVNIDTKNNPYVANGVEGISPKIMLATQHNLVGGWVVVMNFQKDRIGSNQSDFQYLLTLTKSINQKWVVFGETQGIKSDFYADNLFRFGGAHLLSDNFQLDTAITMNTKDTPSVFNISLGASYRLDFHQDKNDDDNN